MMTANQHFPLIFLKRIQKLPKTGQEQIETKDKVHFQKNWRQLKPQVPTPPLPQNIQELQTTVLTEKAPCRKEQKRRKDSEEEDSATTSKKYETTYTSSGEYEVRDTNCDVNVSSN